jgi:hypothetical protein
MTRGSVSASIRISSIRLEHSSVWNATPLAPLLSFRKRLHADLRAELDSQNLLIPVMQGFCGATSIASSGTRSSLGLISRLGWKRAGARFRTRGVDDDGQVANFVEVRSVALLNTDETADGDDHGE